MSLLTLLGKAPNFTLTVDDCAQASTAGVPTLTAHDPAGLAVIDTTQSSTAEQITLTQHHVLVVYDSTQGSTAASVTLTQHHKLVLGGFDDTTIGFDDPDTNFDAAGATNPVATSTSTDVHLGGYVEHGSATLTGTGSASVTGYRYQPGTATLTGTGAASVTAYQVHHTGASLTGAGTMTALGVIGGSALLAAAGTMTVAGSIIRWAQGTLSGVGILGADGRATRSTGATLSGLGTLTAVPQGQIVIRDAIVELVEEAATVVILATEPGHRLAGVEQLGVRTYDVGDRIGASATFALDKVAVDPDSVTCIVQPPDGRPQWQLEVERLGPGLYRAFIDPDGWGEWWYRFDGTGTVWAAEEGCFYIRRQRVLTS